MTFTRRDILGLAVGGYTAQVLLPGSSSAATDAAPIRAVAFDAFPIFDPRPVAARAELLFPGRGSELSSVWRTRQFEYQWLRVLTRQYADFWQATEDSLVYAAELLKLDLDSERRELLMSAYLEMRAWPDVADSLRELSDAGLRLALLSNASPAILESGIANSGLCGAFERVLSTDAIRSYKPDPRAYQMAIDALDLRKEEILFAAFAGWDAAGAKSFGYRTFWVNRLDLPAERLGATPDGVGRGLSDLVTFARAGPVPEAGAGRPPGAAVPGP